MCAYIACPPTEDECTPGDLRVYSSHWRSSLMSTLSLVYLSVFCFLLSDPVVGNEVVAAGIGCDMPFLENPYSASSRLSLWSGRVVGYIAAAALALVVL